MEYTNVRAISNRQFAVIDMDSGTVLGTNVVLVQLPDHHADVEMILSSDSEAHAYAERNGIPLYTVKVD